MSGEPFRLAVIEFLRAELASRVDTVADAMFFGRYRYGENDPLPMGSILEDPRIQDIIEPDEGQGARKGPWLLLLQGFVEDDHENPTKPAYELVGKYQQALADLRAEALTDNLSPLYLSRKVNRVDKISIGAPIVRPPDEFSAKAYCWLPLTLSLVEDPARPFT